VDIDTLVTGSEADVAEQVRVAFASAPRSGGFVLTCGNAVASYVRYTNYLAMNRTARQLNGTWQWRAGGVESAVASHSASGQARLLRP